MLKRRVFVVVSVLLVFVLGLTSCKKNVGSPEDNAVVEEPEEDQQEEIQEEILVGFTAIDMENPYFITLESAIREVIEKEGFELITKDPASSPEDQEAQIKEMIEEGIDGIFLCPVDWEAITPALDALKEADVKRSEERRVGKECT